MNKALFLKNVFPSFLVENEQEFQKKFEIIRKNIKKPYLHIDVMDGSFTATSCWADPKIIRKIVGKTPFEVHLMVKNPLKYITSWQIAGAQRIHFHIEIPTSPVQIVRAIRRKNMEAGVALNVATRLAALKKLTPDAILLMGIRAGASGKPLQKKLYGKIRSAHKRYPSIPLIIDGGVTVVNTPHLLECGAANVVSASALFNLLNKRV